MAVSNRLKTGIRAHPVAITGLLTAIGYVLVIGTFTGHVDPYPDLSASTVDLLTHAIAVINTGALTALVAGVYYIKNDEYDKHRLAMLLAFALILLFLVVYLFRVGGGFEKAIIAPDLATAVYLVMLVIHIVLSVVSVPVVLYAVLLGLTHSYSELKETRKAQIGRIAATAWILSLFLGIVTYVMLNHMYASEPRNAILLFALAVPGGWIPRLRAVLR